MKIHIPNSAFLGNIDSFLASFDPENERILTITLNEKWVSVHPIVLAMIAALGYMVRETGGEIHCDPLSAKSAKYLVRMDLFKQLGIDPGMSLHKHEPSGRFIPLTQIRNSEDLDRFIQELIPLLHTTPNQADAIKYVISELVRNVLEHAQSSHGAMICAQYFEKTKRVSIGVADTGIGIRTTIANAYPVQSDAQAIALALTPGITGTTSRPGGTGENAGAGLFFIKSIAKVNRDFFLIYSGDTAYKLLKTPQKTRVNIQPDPYRDKHSMKRLPRWTGTAVGVDISVEDNEDFSGLLKKIRNVYRLVEVYERKKLKRPVFI